MWFVNDLFIGNIIFKRWTHLQDFEKIYARWKGIIDKANWRKVKKRVYVC